MHEPEPLPLLRQTYIFRRLRSEQLLHLAARFAVRQFEPGDTVVVRGEPADGWYVVAAGKARVIDRAADAPAGPPLVGQGDTFGDASLLDASAWPYSLRAESSLSLWHLTSESFAEFLETHAADDRAMLARRVSLNNDFEFLKRLRPFSHLPLDRLDDIIEALERLAYARGGYLFREDDQSDRCYIVRRGRVQLLKRAGDSQIQLGVRREGDLIGEMELLYGSPRIANAVASTDVELLVLTRDLFERSVPEGDARDAVFQLATERLLQYQNAMSEADAPPAGSRLPDLSLEWAPVPGRLFRRFYPHVKSDSPQTAGLACLTMVDAYHKRESVWHDRLEQLLWDGKPDTLVSFSRKAEDCGYLTRLVTPDRQSLERADLPALIEDDDGTLAVLFRADATRVILGNPTRGVRALDAGEFRVWWSGHLLTLAPPVPHGARVALGGLVRPFATIATASLFVQVFGLGGPLASKVIVDRLLVDEERSVLWLLLVAMAVVVTCQLFATVLRDYLLAHTTRRLTLDLQRRFLQHVLHLRQGVIARRSVADLASRFADNDRLVQRASATALTVVADGLAVLVSFVVLGFISQPMFWIAVTFVILYVGVTLAASPLVRQVSRRSLEARRAVQAHLLEAVSGMQTIKSLLVEPLFLERGRRLMLKLKAGEFAASRLTFNVELAGAILHLCAVVAILGYGARLAATGQATTGDMIASLGIFGVTLVPLTGLMAARQGMREVQAAAASLDDVYRLETEPVSTAALPPPIEGHISFDHVTFRYPGAGDDALHDVTFDVLPGQRVAIVGRSGSGKSTLLNLLVGLYAPTGGNIYVDHVDMQSLPIVALRRQMGVVEQQPYVFDGTIRDNIAKAHPSATADEIRAAARLAGLDEFIAALPQGYDTRVGERGASLSGGERQRLMIARALVGRPRLLVLDEATSAVDARSERELSDNIRQAAAGRTMFVIAHRLSSIRQSDLIVVLDRGRVVETGTDATLMAARGLYYYLNTRSV